MATPKVIPKQFEPSVVAQMEEPITVSVSRLIGGGARTPIILPSRDVDGYTLPPGHGWEKANIANLEGWLVNDWSGGGGYSIKLVDAKGMTFEWQPFFDPQQYPPRTPPTMTAKPTGAVAPAQPAVNMNQMAPMGDVEWPPRGMPMPYATPIPQQVSSMSFPPFPYAFPTARTPTVEDERRRFEDERRQANDRIAQLEREKLEEKHRADLRQIALENDRKYEELKSSLAPKTDEALSRRIDGLEGALSKLLDKLTATPTGPSAETLALQEQNRRLEARLEQEATERRHSEQMAELKRQMEALATRPTGPDPMLTMFLDMMKDQSREMKNVFDSMGRQMLTPQDVLNLAKSTSSGVEDLKSNVVKMFSDMFDLQKRAFENASQLLPQGESPVVRIVEQGIGKAGEMFEAWQQSKDAAQVQQAKAVAAQARTQEAAINAQREQLAQMAARQQQMESAQRNAAHVPSKIDAQLAGVAVPPTQAAAPTNGAATTDGGRVIPFTPKAPDPVKRAGKTDLEWFGGALPHVERLRGGVIDFLNGITQVPPKVNEDGTPFGISPEQCAQFIHISATTMVQQGIHVPAFNELFLDDTRQDDFAMVLLPDTPQNYRNAVLEILSKMDGGDEGDGDDDDEDDDEDDDGEEAPKVAAAPPPEPKTPPSRRPPRQPRA